MNPCQNKTKYRTVARQFYKVLRATIWAFIHKIDDMTTHYRNDRFLNVQSGRMSLLVQLNNTRTARALYSLASRQLNDEPIIESGKLYGKELYFLIPLRAWRRFVPDWQRRREVRLGDVAYWSRGGYLCFFFGQTPNTPSTQILPVAPVVVVGRIMEGMDTFRHFTEFSLVRVDGTSEPSLTNHLHPRKRNEIRS